MARIDTGKVKTSALKQGAKSKNIRGKQIAYHARKPGKAKTVRPVSAYTKQYNTKRVYLYNLMTKQEKMKAYDKARREVMSEMKKIKRLGYDTSMLAVEEVGVMYGKYIGTIPTAKQLERMVAKYGGLGSFKGKAEIENMLRFRNELRNLHNQMVSEYGKESLRQDEKLLNALFDTIEEKRDQVSMEQIGKEKPQSEDLLNYKERGLKDFFREWLQTGSIDEIKVKYEALRKQYEYIVEKILQYFRDSDESYKEEVRKNSRAVFQTTVITNIRMVLKSNMVRFAAENGININSY